jgi:hypothetical protein
MSELLGVQTIATKQPPVRYEVDVAVALIWHWTPR